jgi:hypothetical protein
VQMQLLHSRKPYKTQDWVETRGRWRMYVIIWMTFVSVFSNVFQSNEANRGQIGTNRLRELLTVLVSILVIIAPTADFADTAIVCFEIEVPILLVPATFCTCLYRKERQRPRAQDPII